MVDLVVASFLLQQRKRILVARRGGRARIAEVSVLPCPLAVTHNSQHTDKEHELTICYTYVGLVYVNAATVSSIQLFGCEMREAKAHCNPSGCSMASMQQTLPVVHHPLRPCDPDLGRSLRTICVDASHRLRNPTCCCRSWCDDSR